MVSDLKIKQEHKNSIGIIDLKGQVDLSNAYIIRELIEQELGEGYRKLIINMKPLNFIDSSALGVLIAGAKKVIEARGEMVIVVNEYVERLLSVTGLVAIFNIKREMDLAIDSLEGK